MSRKSATTTAHSNKQRIRGRKAFFVTELGVLTHSRSPFLCFIVSLLMSLTGPPRLPSATAAAPSHIHTLSHSCTLLHITLLITLLLLISSVCVASNLFHHRACKTTINSRATAAAPSHTASSPKAAGKNLTSAHPMASAGVWL